MPGLARHLSRLSSALVAALVLASPAVAHACSVCMSGRDDETRSAFLLTTLFMSVLPVAAVGGGVLWLRRRIRLLEQQESDAEPRLAPARPERASARS